MKGILASLLVLTLAGAALAVPEEGPGPDGRDRGFLFRREVAEKREEARRRYREARERRSEALAAGAEEVAAQLGAQVPGWREAHLVDGEAGGPAAPKPSPEEKEAGGTPVFLWLVAGGVLVALLLRLLYPPLAQGSVLPGRRRRIRWKRHEPRGAITMKLKPLSERTGELKPD